MAETLSVAEMLPNKFEPKRQFRWVFAIEGIDAFLAPGVDPIRSAKCGRIIHFEPAKPKREEDGWHIRTRSIIGDH